MTYGELKDTEMYSNAEDIDLCVNGGEPIDEEYFYVDEICLLDCLPVVGTGHMANGKLLIDLACDNWQDRYKRNWKPKFDDWH
jgi:hypothetical protein